jgi:hypothetical protein
MFPASLVRVSFPLDERSKRFKLSRDQIGLVILLDYLTAMISCGLKLNYEVSEPTHRFERLSNHDSIHIPTL